MSLEQTGTFVAALFLPWSFKWAVAPLIDIINLKRFGGRKAWIVFCTVMMITTLLITAVLDLKTDFQLLLMVVILNNVFCATQDVAIDALAVSTLKEDERGRGNGFMFGGQYLGIALGGGGAIFVYGAWGFNVSLMYISALMLTNLLYILFFVADPGVQAGGADGREAPGNSFTKTLSDFLKNVYTSFLKSGNVPRIALLFSVLPHGTIALGYATLSTIQVDYGLGEDQVAALTTYNTIIGGIGCLIGGVLADRFGVRKVLAISILLTAIPAIVLANGAAQAGITSVSVEVFYASIILHGLFYGMVFALSAAIFMGFTNPVVAATQFTAFMAMTNLTLSYSSYWQGMAAERIGYTGMLLLDALLILAALLLLPFLKSREEQARQQSPKSPVAQQQDSLQPG